MTRGTLDGIIADFGSMKDKEEEEGGRRGENEVNAKEERLDGPLTDSQVSGTGFCDYMRRKA